MFLILQEFPGTVTSGNVTVSTTEIRYNIQMTASISVGGEINEGMLSLATNIFVPDVGEGQSISECLYSYCQIEEM